MVLTRRTLFLGGRASHALLPAFTAVLFASTAAGEEGATPGVVVEVTTHSGSQMNLFASFSATGTAAETDELDLILAPPSNPKGCNAVPHPAPVPGTGWALLVERGNCSFATKAALAVDSGASAVLVYNSLTALYNETSGWLHDACFLDCGLGSGASESSCASSSGCNSGWCAENPRQSGDWCCAVDPLINMGFGNTSDSFAIPAIFVSVNDGERLVAEASAAGGARVRLYERPVSKWDPAMLVVWFIGVLTAIGAAQRASLPERRAASWTWGEVYVPPSIEDDNRRHASHDSEDSESPPADDDEAVELSRNAVLGFVVMSSVFLIVLFFITLKFPHAAVICLNVLFAFATIGAFSKIAIFPLCLRLAPSWSRRTVVLPTCIAESGFPDGCERRCGPELAAPWLNGEVVGVVVALAVSLTWFFGRHEAWAWVLQDILAVCLSCVFLLTIRAPNLRIVTLLFSLFWAYDVFMVFISPLFFGGRSVMLQVATAGGATHAESADKHSCDRVQGERMPMLFLVPRFSWPYSYSMLGLGDVVIPGLLLALARRADYVTRILQALKAGRVPPVEVGEEMIELSEYGFRRSHQDVAGGEENESGARRSYEGVEFDDDNDEPRPTENVGARSSASQRSSPLPPFKGPLSQYLLVCGSGYAIGLTVTYLAILFEVTINGVPGQPALLYLCPFTLVPVMLLAYRRSELAWLWGFSGWSASPLSKREYAGLLVKIGTLESPSTESSIVSTISSRVDGVPDPLPAAPAVSSTSGNIMPRPRRTSAECRRTDGEGLEPLLDTSA